MIILINTSPITSVMTSKRRWNSRITEPIHSLPQRIYSCATSTRRTSYIVPLSGTMATFRILHWYWYWNRP